MLAAAENGQLVYGGMSVNAGQGHYFCQLGQEENMAELISLFEGATKGTESYHRRVGQILGYSEDEINIFLAYDQKSKQHRENAECPSSRILLVVSQKPEV